MNLRAAAITKKLWTTEELQKMYVKCPKDAINTVLVNGKHLKKIKGMWQKTAVH